jgi:hypothetical protein
MIEYRGYIGTFEYDPELQEGHVIDPPGRVAHGVIPTTSPPSSVVSQDLHRGDPSRHSGRARAGRQGRHGQHQEAHGNEHGVGLFAHTAEARALG